ncbi:hypothetical protein SH139x_000628 [Planctomycetaceae bacterium SH139]
MKLLVPTELSSSGLGGWCASADPEISSEHEPVPLAKHWFLPALKLILVLLGFGLPTSAPTITHAQSSATEASDENFPAVRADAAWAGFKQSLTPQRLAQLRAAIESAALQPPAPELVPVKDGTATLQWALHPTAAAYRVVDSRGVIYYEGRLPQAFISGLVDGDHEFMLRALDAEGQVIARAPESTVVVVQHWPLPFAFALLSLGLVVVLVMFGVLWFGGQRDTHERRQLVESVPAGERDHV